jgi:glycosyltransferase involved in cell wall biosynthesis
MEPWKGHTVLIDALVGMASDARWHCWVIGGPQRSSEAEYFDVLRLQVEGAGLASRVSFLGERKDVGRLLSAADVYCQPNAGAEPFGLSFVEALAAGLPVVSTRLGALPEIVTEECGVLVQARQPQAVAAALGRMLDPAVRLRMSAEARKRATFFGNLGAHMATLATALESAGAAANPVSRHASR